MLIILATDAGGLWLVLVWSLCTWSMHSNSRQVSRTSAGSQVGQADCVGTHVGPCTQRSDDLSCSAVMLLVKRSAGVSAEGHYFQQVDIEWISSTPLVTNACSGL